jgi:hypothetical protein
MSPPARFTARIKCAARNAGVEITLVFDLVHVLDLWARRIRVPSRGSRADASSVIEQPIQAGGGQIRCLFATPVQVVETPKKKTAPLGCSPDGNAAILISRTYIPMAELQ